MPSPFVFETIMLICFGAAWPVSIHKSYTSRSNKGKSIFFLFIIFFGYLNGMVFQYLLTSMTHIVLYIFAINGTMVGIDIVLYYRNMILAKRNNH